MDWSGLVQSLLRCQLGSEQPHLIVLVLGAAASTAIVGALYALWRWWRGGRHRRAADALRDEGAHRAQIGHRRAAIDLYTLSIRLNPRAGHVYYLRGLLHESDGNLARAIADWRRSLQRLPHGNASQRKLEQYGALPVNDPSQLRWMYACGASVIGLVVALLIVMR